METYSFLTAQDLLTLAETRHLTLGQIVLKHAAEEQNQTEAELMAEMGVRLQVAREAVAKGLEISDRSKSGLTGGDAKRLRAYQPQHLLLGSTLLKAVTYSFAIMEHNARFGRIVAFPTAGSSGAVLATLLAAQEELKASDEAVILAMFASAGIGIIIAEHAMLAGATGGCQAEVGSASAMAAASLTELRGGTPSQALHAASICLKGMLGLVCDPIGGLVEAPCVKRNATGVSNAFMSSEIALAGVESNVPFDEVVDAMRNIAKQLPSTLRETAKGGLAITPTGKRVWEQVMGGACRVL